jgi:hypothetical protein
VPDSLQFYSIDNPYYFPHHRKSKRNKVIRGDCDTISLSVRDIPVISMSLPINLTKSTIIVLGKLANDGPMCPQEIADKSGLAMRTVTLALKTLQSGNFCRKVPNLMDMRKPLYHADYQKIIELQRNQEIWRSLLHLRFTR